MIKVGDVLASYEGLLDCGNVSRKNLISNIYKLTKNMALESSCLSKEALLRIKFIVSIHDEILKNIEEEKRNFENNPDFLQKYFYRNVDYMRIYSDIEYFQQLIFECEGLKSCISEVDKIPSKLEILNEMDNWIEKRLLINDYELDMYEEEIATKLTKILEKRKEK